MKLYQIRVIKTAVSGYMKWRRSMGVYVETEPVKRRTLNRYFHIFLSNWNYTPNTPKRVFYRVWWYQRPERQYRLEFWNQDLRAWQIFSWHLYETGALKVNKERTERRS